MKNKILKENYTGVCLYCGSIFKNNRSTGRFCPGTTHRQMYGNVGPRIDPLLEDEAGNIINADYLLKRIYEARGGINKDAWSAAYPAFYLREYSAYTGPLPQGEELLVVKSYLIQRCVSNSLTKPRYKIKPIYLLTQREKASRQFISAEEVLEQQKRTKIEANDKEHEGK